MLSAFCHSRMWSGFGHRCYFLLFGGFGSQAGNSWLKPPQGDKTELTRGISVLHPIPGAEAITASQRSLHNAPIFRLLLKVAVNGTHQCDFLNFCGGFGSQLMIEIYHASASSVLNRVGGRAGSTQPSPQAYACWKKLASLLPLEKFCYG